MTRALILLAFIFFSALYFIGPFPAGSWIRHSSVSPGEYVNNWYDSATGKCYYSFSVINPTLWSGQPTFSRYHRGGPHDAGIVDTNGVMYFSGANNVGQDGFGNTTGTTTGAMVAVPTDSAGNTILPIAGIFQTLNPDNGENWFTAAWSSVASGGVVYVAGDTKNGLRGQGPGLATQTKFVKVTMPNNDTVVKIEGYQMCLALTNHDSVISWGAGNYNYALMQGNTPVSNAPGYVHIATGWHPYDIAGGGIMSYILADSVSGVDTFYSVWSGGWQYDPGYQGIGASGTPKTVPQNITNNAFMHPMTSVTHAVQVTSNTETAYFLGANGKGYDIGGNAVATIGNGQSLNFAVYTTNPAPYGGTNSFPYNWDEAQGELMVDTIYNFLPGINDITNIYTGHSNCWFVYVQEANGNEYSWGRNKGTAVGCNQIDNNNGKSIIIIDADPSNGNIASSYPDSWTCVWPNFVYFPPSSGTPTTGTEQSPTSSPYCVTHGSSSPCNIYTISTTAAPTVSAGSNQTISTSSTHLAGVATGAGTSIVNYTTWTQTGGPVAAVIAAPGYQGTLVTGMTATGVYTFKDSAITNNFMTNTATMTVTVTSGCQGCIPVPAVGTIHWISLNKINYEKLIADYAIIRRHEGVGPKSLPGADVYGDPRPSGGYRDDRGLFLGGE
jgi:hypothetical protein